MEEDKTPADDSADYYGSIRVTEMTREIVIKTEALIHAIKDSHEYAHYLFEKELIEGQPDLKQQIEEYRQRNFELQTMVDDDDILEKMEQFEREHAEFLEDPLVDSFLSAEAGFCRMMQDINEAIVESIDF